MDLFTMNMENNLEKNAPLAERFRPNSLEEFIGQKHIVGEGKILNRLISADRLKSMIFYGPPGTGKTTLANIIAKTTDNDFVTLSAVTAGIKELRQIIDIAKDNLKMYNRKTILFIDEIHRFNKSQQDALLPHVERGVIILIGATTENPLFEVNKALLSRAAIMEFKELESSDLDILIDRVLEDEDKGLGSFNIKFETKAREHLLNKSEGDARKILNALELLVLSSKNQSEILITNSDISDVTEFNDFRYDKKGEFHYNIISAFIKSIRGSDPDAALYWLATMLEAGEDPKFIARRIIISASEDIGLANPEAMTIANNCFNAVNFVGMPEARIPLAMATIYLSLSEKSNSAYSAINKAVARVKEKRTLEVPKHLRNININKDSPNYLYPHNYQNAYVEQDYLGIDEKFYEPKYLGEEAKLNHKLDEKKNKLKEG
ncbi:MAG: replication-associated recombination protein A [Tissierellia bacterium]|nr:replication-associated recombination protein A [Tissierellia bacterium]